MSTAAQEAKEARAAEMAAVRESERLKKEPFQTLVKEMHDETRDALKGWQPPLVPTSFSSSGGTGFKPIRL